MNTLVRALAGIVMAASLTPLLAEEAALRIQDPWIREAPPTAEALAAYMKIQNTGQGMRILTGASSPLFGHVMLHGTRIQNDMAQMFHLDEIRIPPGETVVFEPGGNHFMLMRPQKALVAGDAVPLELEFKEGRPIPLMVEVRKGAEDSHEHRHH